MSEVKKAPTVKWTEEEMKTLHEMHLKLGMAPIEIYRSGRLPGRTKHSIAQQSFKIRSDAQHVSHAAQIKAQAAALIASIPNDNRNTTARLFGDPVFERSALFQKIKAESSIPIRRAS